MSRMLNVSLALPLMLCLGALGCQKKSDDQAKKVPAKAARTVPAKPGKVTVKAAGKAHGGSLADAGGEYDIDSAHTQVLFKIKHLGVSFQYGMFTRVEGGFTIDATEPSKSTISLSIPTGSVFTAVKKRDDHLRSPDFFDAKQFPTIAFKSKRVEATGPSTYTVIGDLAMHGVTKEVSLALEHVGAAVDPKMMGGKFRTGFNGKATIKRSEWGINYMLGKGLDDEVILLLAIEGTRK